MRLLFTPQDVRAMDRRAIDRGVDEGALMDRAAGHLARAVLAEAGRAYGLRVAILAGKGNNGGDGFAAATRLADAGASPVVCSVHDPAELTGLPAARCERARARGIPITTDPARALAGADLAVDCLLGTGAHGAPRPPESEAIAALAGHELPVVACDAPSGVDARTGAVAEPTVRADRTVTLGADKVGLWLPPARALAGRVEVGDLGIVEPDDVPAARLLDPVDVAAALPGLEASSHKRSRGVVTVVAGSPGMSGAAALAAWGAQALGAGLVQIATSAGVRDVVAGLVPEALTVALPNSVGDAARAVAEACERSDALVIGPGLGTSDGARSLVRALLANLALPTVLDADGLNAVADDPERLRDAAPEPLVLTPHAGELARLTGAGDALSQRLDLAPDRAERWDAVIVAKGPSTIVAGPDRSTWVTPTGGPELATGGTGDVLAGMLAADLAARQAGAPASRTEPEAVAAARAAAAVTWLHGRAGELAAAAGHPRSVTAGHVASTVPAALDELAGTR